MRTTETERRAYVEAFHRSGLRLIDFCRERGLNQKTVYRWRKLYSSKVADQLPAFVGESTFLPLKLKNNEAAAEGCVNSARILTFKTQKFCLEVALDVRHSGAELKLIVQTLQEVL
jgi:transposase-like protein